MGQSPSGSPAAAVKADALAYLASHHTVSLATVGPDGIWATTVFYVNLTYDLYFLSEPKTRHVLNALANPAVAATINEDYADWQQIKGIQMSGACTEVGSKREIARVLAAYVRKYPFVRQFLSPGQFLKGLQVAGRALDVHLYRLRPDRLLYLDNQRGFSNRENIPLEANS